MGGSSLTAALKVMKMMMKRTLGAAATNDAAEFPQFFVKRQEE